LIHKIIVYFLFIFFPCIANAQVPQGYRVDTLFKESPDHPGVFDTVIVYKKINVINQQVTVQQLTERKVTWQTGIGTGAGVFWLSDISPISSSDKSEYRTTNTLMSADLIAEVKADNITIIAEGGLSQFDQELVYKYNSVEVTSKTTNVSDTVDIYYVEDGSGNKVPVPVIKQREILSHDSVFTPRQKTFSNTIFYAQAGLKLGYTFRNEKIAVTPMAGYTMAFPVSIDPGVVVLDADKGVYPVTRSSLRKVVSSLSLEAKISRQLGNFADIYLKGLFLYNLNSMLKEFDTRKYYGGGLHAGIIVRLSR
jgi:hypothetical protein